MEDLQCVCVLECYMVRMLNLDKPNGHFEHNELVKSLMCLFLVSQDRLLVYVTGRPLFFQIHTTFNHGKHPLLNYSGCDATQSNERHPCQPGNLHLIIMSLQLPLFRR